tara:strand:- start:190 stop:711 length:522 start_codon:yes stop_codon:yes gene_type:complete
MTPLVIIAIALIGKFLELWVGAEFAGRAIYIPEIILFGIWINAFVIPTYTRHLAKKNPRTIFLIYLFEIPVYLIALFVLLENFGLVGAAFAWAFRVLIDTVIILKINSAIGIIVKENLCSIGIMLIFISALTYGVSSHILVVYSVILAGLSIWLDRDILLNTYHEIRGTSVEG